MFEICSVSCCVLLLFHTSPGRKFLTWKQVWCGLSLKIYLDVKILYHHSFWNSSTRQLWKTLFAHWHQLISRHNMTNKLSTQAIKRDQSHEHQLQFCVDQWGHPGWCSSWNRQLPVLDSWGEYTEWQEAWDGVRVRIWLARPGGVFLAVLCSWIQHLHSVCYGWTHVWARALVWQISYQLQRDVAG